MTLDTETCLSELQPEGTFTDTWKSDHAPAQRPQGPPAPALPTSEPQVHRPLPAPQRHQLSSSLKALRNSALSRMCFLICPGLSLHVTSPPTPHVSSRAPQASLRTHVQTGDYQSADCLAAVSLLDSQDPRSYWIPAQCLA